MGRKTMTPEDGPLFPPHIVKKVNRLYWSVYEETGRPAGMAAPKLTLRQKARVRLMLLRYRIASRLRALADWLE